ncbi:N-terminal acetyltransferase B complex auxiliary subunit NAA25-like isoform X2 [Papaver somniferum]|uniref:N-terminal acetyltransferase B complex auxiliary subunit NAA25-like isoform X2 n=1 Tax=Papaver somniferum TaxID=3469 RepID=UPI000E6FA4F8|nr:N-terminal acetyltransferase B complex auxiliary subunit NAA25-like isoform X2 [Papaver somniferum]
MEALAISTPEDMKKQDWIKKDKLHQEVVSLPKRECSKFEPQTSLSADLISSLPDQQSSKRLKLEDQASSAVASSKNLILKNQIQLVKDSIESRQFIKALKLINALQSEFPTSALVLALKALVYEKTVGKAEALSICSDTKEHMLSDISVLPDVLTILETVCQRLGRLDMAIGYYEHACGKGFGSLELMRGLFNCYARESSFVKQLGVSVLMYKLVREDKFLFWAVLCIQLQVLSHLLKKQTVANSDEPEAFLVYISMGEQQAMYDPAHEILSKLGSTLLVVKFDKQRSQGGRLLAHVCDYTAAVEAFKKILESCPGDWQSFLKDICCSLEDDSKYRYLACKISQLPMVNCGSEISKALQLSNLKNARNRCLHKGKDSDALEEAIYEYFNSIDHTAQRFFQVLSKDEECQLIENLIKPDILTPDLLKEEFSKICIVSSIPKRFGNFSVGEGSRFHGTTIVIKTNKFIILAGDGKLTSAYSDNALLSRSDKVRQFDDLCIAICGVWKGFSNTVSILRKYMRCFKKNGKGRPTVRKFAEYIADEAPLLNRVTEVVVCAFDDLEDDQTPAPCVSCADKSYCFDVEKSFYCSGSCVSHVKSILSEGNIRPDMGLAEAITLVERALVVAAIFDNCTGGLANITVIDNYKNVKVMAREHIRTTLWERHRYFFENREKTKI